VVRLGTTEVSGVNGVGHSPGWAPLNQVDFVEGRDFVTVEFQEARAVLIVSEQLARDLVGEAPIVGTRVHLVAGPDGGLPMTVVGVMVPPANPFSDEAAHQAVVPVTTAMRRLGAARTLSEFVVVPAPDVVLDQVEDGVISALRTMRGLAPGEENNFAVIRATELLEFFDRFTFVFFVVMLALSSAGLLVGGVGVVGIMLISVTRTNPRDRGSKGAGRHPGRDSLAVSRRGGRAHRAGRRHGSPAGGRPRGPHGLAHARARVDPALGGHRIAHGRRGDRHGLRALPRPACGAHGPGGGASLRMTPRTLPWRISPTLAHRP
jgi:hypothetical protein